VARGQRLDRLVEDLREVVAELAERQLVGLREQRLDLVLPAAAIFGNGRMARRSTVGSAGAPTPAPAATGSDTVPTPFPQARDAPSRLLLEI
jgi:hypothetical protein